MSAGGPPKLHEAYLAAELEAALQRMQIEREVEQTIMADGAAARDRGRSIYSNPWAFGTSGFDWWRRGFCRRAMGEDRE
jgi:hypothetical protein